MKNRAKSELEHESRTGTNESGARTRINSTFDLRTNWNKLE